MLVTGAPRVPLACTGRYVPFSCSTVAVLSATVPVWPRKYDSGLYRISALLYWRAYTLYVSVVLLGSWPVSNVDQLPCGAPTLNLMALVQCRDQSLFGSAPPLIISMVRFGS